MDITRLSGDAIGRAAGVAWDKLVYTVATAGHVGDDLQAQTAASLAQIDRNLAELGSDKTKLLAATVYLTEIARKAEMDEVWCAWIGGSENWPQRACVGVQLAGNDLVEIVIIATR